jgi:hypothetical protein
MPLMSFDDKSTSLMNIKNEIFDMVKPVDPLRITMQDLLRSGPRSKKSMTSFFIHHLF